MSEPIESLAQVGASPTSLAELFARHPLELSQEERAKVIEELRRARTEYQTKKKEKQNKPKKEKGAHDNISLDDLALDI